MIADSWENLHRYYGVDKNLDLIIEKQGSFTFEKMENGRHEINGEHVFLNLMPTSLGEGGCWEAHRKYIDLQLILENEETIGWAPLRAISDFSGYDEQKDIMLSFDPQQGSRVLLKKGMFALFFPDDAHQPGIGRGQGRKAVFKIQAEEAPLPSPEAQNGPHHLGTQALNSPRLLLRPYREGDEQAMFDNWCGRAELARFLPWAPHRGIEVTRQVLSDWLRAYQSPKTYHWGIEMGGKLIGDIAVMNQNTADLICEIGYCLSPDHWNQGIMTEALNRVMRFLFAEVGYNRIQLRHLAENEASGRVMEKAGLKYEGTLRQSVRTPQGKLADAPLYAALREEWLREQHIL